MSKIEVKTTVNKEIEAVWNHFLAPEHIINWNFASDDWHCTKAEVDLRVGGIHATRMEAKDGSFGFDFNLIFTSISPEQSVSYKMEDGREATTTFKESDSSVEMITIFDAETENTEELQKAGWQAILENFKKYVEAK